MNLYLTEVGALSVVTGTDLSPGDADLAQNKWQNLIS